MKDTNGNSITAKPAMRLRALFDAAVAAAQPAHILPRYLSPKPHGKLVVIGAGKASAAMARAVEDHWSGDLSGLVVTRHGYGVPCKRIEIVEAAHPVPDDAGLAAARRIFDLAASLGANDKLLCLISGGGSALLPLPLPGVTLADKQAINRALLSSGASIGEMNIVRRHLSAIKGGRLAAAAYPAKLTTLLISDVPGDDPADIASGPTVADATTRADALAVLRRYAIAIPPGVMLVLESESAESVKPGDPRLAGHAVHIIAAPRQSLDAAAKIADVPVRILGDAIEGEAREVAKAMAKAALEAARGGGPCLLLSGGETSVTLRGKGCGGRNVEFLLALAIALDGHPRIHALAADTDGVDGMAEVAGAVIGPDTLARAQALGMDAARYLADNDAHSFFAGLGDQVITGPTLTNVNDFRAILVEGP
jgi:hydroxypyruvate reductase